MNARLVLPLSCLRAHLSMAWSEAAISFVFAALSSTYGAYEKRSAPEVRYRGPI